MSNYARITHAYIDCNGGVMFAYGWQRLALHMPI